MAAVIIVILLVAVLSYANGANDNSKGVATLVGFGAATPKQALICATITTAIGAGFSFLVAKGMINAFKAGIFKPGTEIPSVFFCAVLCGAVGWVLFANRTGMPVSTTHAIVGGLIGAGLVRFGGGQIVWPFLGKSVAVPLVLGPVISTALVYLLAWPVVAITRGGKSRVVVVERDLAFVSSGGTATVAIAETVSQQTVDAPPTTQTIKVADIVHWASGGMVGFARGWNDAPKIAALSIVALTAAKASNPAAVGFGIVIVAMAIGGLVSGRRVLDTLSKKLTPLPLAESLTASVATAALVSAASWVSLPVSTTHVATGAIVGAGLKNDPSAVKWSKVTEIALSWVITLPVAAIISALVMLILNHV
jgi:PiT family inorganic phosphate transporter